MEFHKLSCFFSGLDFIHGSHELLTNFSVAHTHFSPEAEAEASKLWRERTTVTPFFFAEIENIDVKIVMIIQQKQDLSCLMKCVV